MIKTRFDFNKINTNKYTPIYSGGGNPEIYEADVFRIAIPLTKDAVKQIEKEMEITERAICL